MELVKTLHQVLENIDTLEAARIQTDPSNSYVYRGLIKAGICFLPYLTSEGLAFAPSRFIGYIGNSFARHAANERRDGRETNRALYELLGFHPKSDPILENEYLRFCERIGITPSKAGAFGVARKYWIVPEVRDRIDQIAEEAVLNDQFLKTT